jgi:hypothetical protein
MGYSCNEPRRVRIERGPAARPCHALLLLLPIRQVLGRDDRRRSERGAGRAEAAPGRAAMARRRAGPRRALFFCFR